MPPGAGRGTIACLLGLMLLAVLALGWLVTEGRGGLSLGAAKPDDAAPRLISKVSDVEFGQVSLGNQAEERLLLFHGGGSERTITVFNVWLAEPDAPHYSVQFDGPVELHPGESLVLPIRFAPGRTGEIVSPLYVSHDGESGVEIFTLIGDATDTATGQLQRRQAPEVSRRAAPGVNRPSFNKSLLAGIGNVRPTSLQFGPDGRLYVADMLGLIKIYDVERRAANNYEVSASETITLVRDIPNHDDDGRRAPNVTNRLVTGLLVTGTAQEPVIYVGSSDPRIGGGHTHTDTDLDTNSSIISRLTRQGQAWKKQDLVRGLPRSEENHHVNGMVLDEGTNRLYVSAGGNTNLGAPSNNFAGLPEFALSAAILEIDLGAIGDTTHDLPTLNDDSRSGVNDANDPFGGNNGKNQAMLVPGGPVQVYAPGFRNAYDLVVTEAGRMYSVDNGGNAGWGGTPKGGTSCSNARSEPGATHFDGLHHITGRGYYGGHANPTRGNASNDFNADGASPVAVSNAIECVHAGTGKNGTLAEFRTSANGLVEYRASNFGGAMQGDLLTVAFDNVLYQLRLNEAGTAVLSNTKLFSNVGGIPLDVTAQADWQRFPGTIWVADFQARSIVVFEPGDFDASSTTDEPLQHDGGSDDADGPGGPGSPGSPGACGTQPSADDDGDGFSNGDEIANGTDPCSGADRPTDADGDGVSDLSDADDDNDGLEDRIDPFALDPRNGRGTSLPLDYTWENDSNAPGYLFNLGFSGLMNDGASDWRDQFDVGNLTTGGAAGVLTIDRVPDGDPIGARNDQTYAFQFGIDATPDTEPFVVHTRVVAPLAGASRKPYQSLGLFIGTGDQDNYIKLVVNTAGPRGGVQFAAERAGSFDPVHQGPAIVYDTDFVDLLLRVDPRAGQVRAFHRSRDGGKDAEWIAIGASTSLPTAWLNGSTGLAVGLISTSLGAEPFSATWDFVRVGDPGIVDGQPADTDDVSPPEDIPPGDEKDADGDGQEDPSDPFPLDAADGRATPIPLDYGWNDGDADGFLLDSGFSGLMSNGTTDWRASYDRDNLTIGGAAGVLSIGAVPATDPIHDRNDQAYGLQFGIDVTQDTAPFVVRTRLPEPLAGASRKPHQSLGLYIGTGDQDNYIKLVANTFGAQGGVQFAAERDGRFEHVKQASAALYGSEWIDLLLHVDPQAELVRAYRQVRSDSVDGPLVAVGAPTALPSAWLNARSGLAVGLISTSVGAAPFTATWDHIRVVDAGTVPGVASSGGDQTGDQGNDQSGDQGDSPDNGQGDGNVGNGGDDGDDSGDDSGGNGNGNGDGDDISSGDGRLPLMIEAESAIRTSVAGGHRWQRGSPSGASAGGSMRALPDVGTLRATRQFSPELVYRVDFPTPGTWYVWVRGLGDTDSGGEGKNDSVHVGVNGVLDAGTAIAGFPANRWTWTRSTRGGSDARIEVPTGGSHEISVWMREDGFEIDRLLFTQDPTVVPTGDGAPVDSNEGTSPADDTDDDTADDTDGNTDDGDGSGTGGGTGGGGEQAGPIASRDGVLRVEATDHGARAAAGGHDWRVRDGSVLTALPNVGQLRANSAGSPRLDYRVAFDRAGTWQVWVHGFGDADASNEGGDDSVHVGLDGRLGGASAMDGFPPRWSWSRSRRSGGPASVVVDAPGVHTLNVWMREDGFAFDRLVLIGPGAAIDHPDESGGASAPAGDAIDDDGDGDGGNASGGAAGSVSADADWVPRNSGDGSRIVPRHEGSGVEYRGRLYVLGGRGKRAVSVYDPVTNRWSVGATPPIELNHFQPVVFDDRIWVIGAMTGGYPRETSVPAIYTYDPLRDVWAKERDIPADRRRGSVGAAVHDGRIYLLGGNQRGHDGRAVAWFDAFDPSSGTWTVLPDAPNRRDHAPIGIANGRLVAAGGRRSTQPNVFANTVTAVDVYDFASGQWRQTSSIPTPRAGTMVVGVGDEIVVIGGESPGTAKALTTVEAYDVTTERWRSLDAMVTGRHGGAAALLVDGIHAVSGNLTRGGGAETTLHEVLPVRR